MKITIESPLPGEEDEIIIKMAELDDEVLKVIRRLKDGVSKDTMAVYANESILMVPIRDILYFDATDNRVFAYTRDNCFETRKKLFEIEELLANSSFLRISKNAIVNIKSIDHLSPEFNGRFIASLKNGEDIIISRGYVPELKKKLGIGK
ncbi:MULTISPECIES: LytTR family DNA-binding domain-containing protein [unclassified Butyrivibrio]|jgi:DNA-binding LytR/AlgR family response regulator|uniref:LytTR family DNA-binding domain-containing protein n=1 Tax=unclassified Butyrivibrio TaxID=2639466 RepID=UPI000421A926|nr:MULTISPECIES: LytTR family DNA-binding domain-containing protein [unclassified Butyrivibrio]